MKKADEGACEEEEDGEGDDNKEDEKEAGNDDDEEEEVDDDDDDDEENDEDGEDDEEGSLQFGQSAHLNKDPDEKMLGEQRLGDQLWDAVHDFSDPEEEVVNIQGKSLRVLSERRGHLVLHFDA